MLTEPETTEIRSELAHYADSRAVVPEALKIVQHHRGWISDDAVADVAGILRLSPAEVDGIATFYNLIFRRPVGRHVILVCDSISCWATGYQDIFRHLTERLGIGLGQTTPDNRFTLLPTACLGLCEQAPAMLIDNDPHGNLTAAKIDEILVKYA